MAAALGVPRQSIFWRQPPAIPRGKEWSWFEPEVAAFAAHEDAVALRRNGAFSYPKTATGRCPAISTGRRGRPQPTILDLDAALPNWRNSKEHRSRPCQWCQYARSQKDMRLSFQTQSAAHAGYPVSETMSQTALNLRQSDNGKLLRRSASGVSPKKQFSPSRSRRRAVEA